ARIVEGTEQDAVVRRGTSPGVLPRVRCQWCDEVIVDALLHQYASCGRAVLACVEVAGGGDSLDSLGDVRVVEDDHRGLATEFEVNPLEVGRGRLGDLHSGAHGAGDRNQL